ncbi:MAG: type II toxin-antitoxin system RelE/ParE family toxin [candidate division WOR-3 bacterium]
MKYALFVERYAQKQIMKLDKSIIPVLKRAIAKLSDNPRPPGYIKLKGEEAYRIRVRDFRIIYEIDDMKKTVTVVAIGHRKNIYK